MTKYLVERYNPIRLYNTCPLKQKLFGWFIYKDFLRATCWNNRTLRVESTGGKTVHKLFVGGVLLNRHREDENSWTYLHLYTATCDPFDWYKYNSCRQSIMIVVVIKRSESSMTYFISEGMWYQEHLHMNIEAHTRIPGVIESPHYDHSATLYIEIARQQHMR